MKPPSKVVIAKAFTVLPAPLHHQGPPSAWARMTRPGQAMHSFLEGPTIGTEGDLWLADVPYGRLFRVDQHGQWHVAFQYEGEPHALKLMSDGRIAIVDYSKGLLALDPQADRIEVLAADDNGQPFLGLSDIALSPEGDIWFTDSGRTSLSDPRGRLYRRGPSGPIERILECIPYPNGVVLSPDGKFVYLAVTRANAVWRLKADDAENPPMVGTYIHLSGGLGPDGLAMSTDGFLALAQAQKGRAYVFNQLGDLVSEILTPDGTSTTSVLFDKTGTLFVIEAESGTIYRVPATDWKP